jgi:probable HAF family extracellular repeat protein
MSVPKRRLTVAVLGLLVTLALIGWFSRPSPPRYTITDLGVLPGDTFSGASGVNNRGEVVGLSGAQRIDRRHAFLYRNGVMTDLGRFGLIGSHDGPAINDSGQVTGVVQFGTQASGPGQKLHAFLYDAGGMHDLGTPPGYSMSLGGGINSRGQIVYEAWGNKPGAAMPLDHAFLASGGAVDIGILPGCWNTIPAGINATGRIVGYSQRQIGGSLHAFIYDSRTRKMTALATPPGFTGSVALGINDQAQIIGSAVLSNEKEQAVLWADGIATDLGTLPGLDNTSGAAINNWGEAVGTAWSRMGALARFVNDHPIHLGPLLPLFPQQETQRAFIYRAGRMTDLNALIPADAGWVLQKAQGINDRGQIVGRGLHHGQERAFLLTPVR